MGARTGRYDHFEPCSCTMSLERQTTSNMPFTSPTTAECTQVRSEYSLHLSSPPCRQATGAPPSPHPRTDHLVSFGVRARRLSRYTIRECREKLPAWPLRDSCSSQTERLRAARSEGMLNAVSWAVVPQERGDGLGGLLRQSASAEKGGVERETVERRQDRRVGAWKRGVNEGDDAGSHLVSSLHTPLPCSPSATPTALSLSSFIQPAPRFS